MCHNKIFHLICWLDVNVAHKSEGGLKHCREPDKTSYWNLLYLLLIRFWTQIDLDCWELGYLKALRSSITLLIISTSACCPAIQKERDGCYKSLSATWLLWVSVTMCTWNAFKDLNLNVICSFMELLHGLLFGDSANQTHGDGPNYLEEKQVLIHSKESLQACQKHNKCTLLCCVIWKVNVYFKLNRNPD